MLLLLPRLFLVAPARLGPPPETPAYAFGRYDPAVLDEMRAILDSDARIAYALLFGSFARGTSHAGSDVDVAVGLMPGARLGAMDVGNLVSRLESAVKRRVDLILLDEAPLSLAYRVFRDGRTILERDHPALVARKARAVLEYLDFKPIEELATRGVLSALTRGR